MSVDVTVLLHAPGEPPVERTVTVPGFDRYPANDTDSDDFYDALITAARAAGYDTDDIDDWYAPATPSAPAVADETDETGDDE